jgi:hypothetical protein
MAALPQAITARRPAGAAGQHPLMQAAGWAAATAACHISSSAFSGLKCPVGQP